MKKKTLVLLLCAGGFLFVAGLLLFLLMSYINIEKSKAFFISLGLMGAGAAVLLWLLFFKLIEKIVMKNVPNTEEALRARREELSEKLDILLEGSDFEQLERQAKQSVSTARSAAEIDRDLEAVNKEMEEIRTKLNKELTE